MAYFGIGIPDHIVGLSNFSDVILREKGAIKRYGKYETETESGKSGL